MSVNTGGLGNWERKGSDYTQRDRETMENRQEAATLQQDHPSTLHLDLNC